MKKHGIHASVESELKALDSKKEGDFYIKQKKYSQTVEAYNNSLECTASDDMRHKVKLILCRAFHKSGQTDKCIRKAEDILNFSSNDFKAYLWLSLAYSEVERAVDQNFSTSRAPKTESVEDDCYGEPSYTFGALAFFLSFFNKYIFYGTE